MSWDRSVQETLCILDDIADGAENDELHLLKNTLGDLLFDQRCYIVNKPLNGFTPLYRAARVNNESALKYLLDECGAQVNLGTTGNSFAITPLHVAVQHNCMEAMAVLLRHGANVNEISLGTTPISVAVTQGNLKMVDKLLEYEADINKLNLNGETPLMKCANSIAMFNYLLIKGAYIHQRDLKGHSMMHFAAMSGNLGCMRVLRNRHADPYVTNKDGENVFKTAAIYGHLHIVGYLLMQYKVQMSLEAEFLEIIGADLILHDENIQGTTMHSIPLYWHQAIKLRKLGQFPKKISFFRQRIHCFYSEFQTQNDLDNIEGNYAALKIQALMVLQRILGLTHWKTLGSFRDAAKTALIEYDLSRSLGIYTFLLRIYWKRPELLENEDVEGILKLLSKLQAVDGISFKDVLLIFRVVLKCMHYKNVKPSNPQDLMGLLDFQNLLILILRFIDFIRKLKCLVEQAQYFNGLVYRLLKTDPRGFDNTSLLHLVCDPNCQLDTVEMTKYLLVLGADVNWRDNSRSTPLHYVIDCIQADGMAEIFNSFIEHGAHLDATDEDGTSPLRQLDQMGFLFNPTKFLSLKCLSAQVISNWRIPFQNKIPKQLYDFIENH